MTENKPVKLKKERTARGFNLIKFQDSDGVSCTLQESASAMQERIWFGVDTNKVISYTQGEGWEDYPLPDNVQIFNRMHLNKEQVKALLPYLISFVDKGVL